MWDKNSGVNYWAATGRVGAGAATPWMYMYSLFAIPVILLCIGVSYILGARKIQRQQDAIKEKQRSIYGDKF